MGDKGEEGGVKIDDPKAFFHLLYYVLLIFKVFNLLRSSVMLNNDQRSEFGKPNQRILLLIWYTTDEILLLTHVQYTYICNAYMHM